MINTQGLYRIAIALDNIHQNDDKGINNLDICKIKEEMEIVSAYFKEFEKDIEEINSLKDKLSRRNLQIKDLRAKLKDTEGALKVMCKQ